MPGLARSLALALLLASPFACSSSDDTASGPDAPDRPTEVAFPAGFLWGTSTAAFQVEKGNAHTDWGHWVETPGKIKNGDKPDVGGPDALAHIDEDVALMKAEGHTAYRFSIEWGRVYPTREAFDADTPDEAALAAYADLLAKLRAAGIAPMVTLSHFALPDYLADIAKPSEPQGWERPETSDLFVEYTKRMAARFGKDVDWWITLNEPLNVVLAGYIQGSFPPGVVLDVNRAFTAARAEARVHARAYDAIHAADTIDADGDGKAAWVSFAAHQRTYHPYDPAEEDDVRAAEHMRYVANLWFLNAVTKGDWDEDLDGAYTGPNDKTADPAMKGRLDYIGVNYYSDTLISARRGIVIPQLNAAIYQDHLATDRPKTDFAWDIYPEGFGTVLDEAKGYGLPILVTENGIADATDVNRGRYIAEHLFELGLAITRGADIRGYFHWALVDNFEWASGYCPRFGLHTVDKTTGQRAARPSAHVYTSIIRASKISQKEIDAMPPYGAPTPCN
jgi:beta-glucosidase/6-phospho-beta-glucosidase/beta-galactosidase